MYVPKILETCKSPRRKHPSRQTNSNTHFHCCCCY